MIGKLSGIVGGRAADHVLIDVGGVGYVVHCSDRTLAALPPDGSPVALFTELVVREDLLQLLGFATPAEREWHRALTGVQGVGAKAALAILGTLGADGLSRAIALGDTTAIRRAPGIGPKIAERAVRELKGKVPAVMALGAAGAAPAALTGGLAPRTAPASLPGAAETSTAGEGAHAAAEALSALVNLGYGEGEAAAAVAAAAGEGAEGTGAIVRSALRRLAPQGA